jgi:gluconate 2-dehydrogenase gamma chain
VKGASMNRREVLQRVAVLMGGAVSAPALLAVLNGCSAKKSEVAVWKPVFLSEQQAALIAEVTELIIPKTDTPGAKDVGVPEFIDKMLKDVYAKEAQDRFLSGLQAFEAEAQSQFGKPYLQLDAAQRTQHLQSVHDAALRKEWEDKEPNRSARRPFILMTKELTLLGFFTSEVGASQVLQWVPVPGALHSCIPLSQAGNGHAWAVENTARF